MTSALRTPSRSPLMTISRETLAKLAKFDTPTICNVIELFDIRPRNRGYMDHRVKCNFPELPPMVGFAARPLPQRRPAGRRRCLRQHRGAARPVRQAARPGGRGVSGPRRSAGRGRVRRGDVLDVPGVRLGGPGHQRRGPRPGAGAGPQVPRVHRLDDLLARLLPHAAPGAAGAGGLADGQPGRPACTATPTA